MATNSNKIIMPGAYNPGNGLSITSGFPSRDNGSPHNGVDWSNGNSAGTPVVAAMDGIVLYSSQAGERGGRGNQKNGIPAKDGATELSVVVPESAKERKTEKNGPVQSLCGVPGINIDLIVAVFLLVANLVTTNAYAGETENYHGQIILEGQIPDYDPGRGSCVSDGPDSCPLGLTGSELIAQNGKKIEVIWLTSNTGNRDAKGHIIWRIEDTIEFPSDYKGTFETEPGGCTSSAYPEAMIIAKGKWHNRKSPKVGGFMRPIDKAWRVDFKTRKFVEISNKGVVCELNEDRD